MNIFSILFLVFFAGCASYQYKVAPAKDLLKNKNCSEATYRLEKLSSESSSDQLALLMEYGTALQICRDYEKSNFIFSQAELLSESIDYTSVTETAGATLFNEGLISYKGDTFEKLFLNASKALNYLEINKTDDALVEVKKMNQKFSKFKNEERKNYELNSFSKYLSAVIWESTGQYDDACIDYQDAYYSSNSNYQYPNIGFQMLITCWQADRKDEFRKLAKSVSASPEDVKLIQSSKKSAEIIFIYLQGWGPEKKQSRVSNIYPELVKIKNETQKISVDLFKSDSVYSVKTALSTPIYSVEQAAKDSLLADQASLTARRLAAGITKHIIADQIRQKDELLGLISLIVMKSSEQADLRQWSFLPNEIHVIRMNAEPGQYTAKVKGLDQNQVLSEEFTDLTFSVDKKQKKIFMIRSLK